MVTWNGRSWPWLSTRRLAAAAAVSAVLHLPSLAQAPARFADRIAALSESGGYFDTDNLISNERSYLEVIPELSRRRVRGGVYIGVGPDQNFTYIAAVRPSTAFIVDIRRDNLLLHLLFKALFELADSRIAYLSLLFGRMPPPDTSACTTASIQRILAHVEERRPDDPEVTRVRAKVAATVARFGVPLSDQDLRTIDRFHRTFVQARSSLRFQSAGRPPRGDYPTYGELLMARDADGRGGFLGSEEAFRFVQDLQRRDAIVPVVGDVSGTQALAAIAALLERRRERVSALYISNVEFYLFRADGRFARYVDNLRRLPHSSTSVIISSAFGPYASGVRGYSSSHVQSFDELLDRANRGAIAHYGDLLR